jgi:hypothetical protein
VISYRLPSRHSTERGSAGSTEFASVFVAFDPAVPCLLGIIARTAIHTEILNLAYPLWNHSLFECF